MFLLVPLCYFLARLYNILKLKNISLNRWVFPFILVPFGTFFELDIRAKYQWEIKGHE